MFGKPKLNEITWFVVLVNVLTTTKYKMIMLEVVGGSNSKQEPDKKLNQLKVTMRKQTHFIRNILLETIYVDLCELSPDHKNTK